MTTKITLPENLASAINDRIDDLSDTLLEVSHSIHANPELAFQEHHAAGLLADTLDDRGLPAERGVFTLETAFEARLPTRGDGPTVAILAEYDALPGIGHACGHNLIATAALGAGLGLNAVASQLPGTVRLIGTPAEEKGGGVVLAELTDEHHRQAELAYRALPIGLIGFDMIWVNGRPLIYCETNLG